jgi:hypothetical protein
MAATGVKKRSRYHAVCPADGSDGQGWLAIRIVGVKATFAGRAKQVRGAHAGLAQDQLELRLLAFRAGFAHCAEGRQIERDVAGYEGIDDAIGLHFSQDQLVFWWQVMAAAMVILTKADACEFKYVFTHAFAP